MWGPKNLAYQDNDLFLYSIGHVAALSIERDAHIFRNCARLLNELEWEELISTDPLPREPGRDHIIEAFVCRRFNNSTSNAPSEPPPRTPSTRRP